MAQRRKCRLANSAYKAVDLRQYQDLIITTIEEILPGKHPHVYQDYFSTDPLTQGEAILLGRELSKLPELAQYGEEATSSPSLSLCQYHMYHPGKCPSGSCAGWYKTHPAQAFLGCYTKSAQRFSLAALIFPNSSISKIRFVCSHSILKPFPVCMDSFIHDQFLSQNSYRAAVCQLWLFLPVSARCCPVLIICCFLCRKMNHDNERLQQKSHFAAVFSFNV